MAAYNVIGRNALVMSAIIAAFLLLRLALYRRVNPLATYAAGLVLVVGLLMPLRPPLPGMLSLADWQPGTQAHQPGESAYMLDREDEEATSAPAMAADAITPNDHQTHGSAPSGSLPGIAAALPWLWACGSLLSALHMLARHIRFRRFLRRWLSPPSQADLLALERECRRLGIRRKPQLLRCTCAHSPMLIGLLRPAIILPHAAFDEASLRFILQHELVHLRRGDLWHKLMMLSATALHWWNPLVHGLIRTLSADCEISCDQSVLRHAGLMERRQYGETILSVIAKQRERQAILSTYFYERKTDVKRRFATMLDLRPRRLGILLVAATLALTLFSGSVLAANPSPRGDGLSPTTGLPTDKPYRPVLVNISNSQDARPPWGLADADIVYEAVVWGPGHTRYLALYNDTPPAMAGSIRGARVYQAEIRQEWDCPFVFNGGQQSEGTDIYAYFAEKGVDKAFRYDGLTGGVARTAFTRSQDRENPHNGVVDVAWLVENCWPTSADGTPYEPQRPTFRFSNTPSGGSESASTIRISYEDENVYQPMYTFNAAERLYERWYDGAEQYDFLSGRRIVASNVIVQYCGLSFYGGAPSRPVMETVGEGAIDAFIDGRHIRGLWKRATAESRTEYFDSSGNPLVLLPGKTFIQILPPELGVAFTNSAGETLRFSGVSK